MTRSKVGTSRRIIPVPPFRGGIRVIREIRGPAFVSLAAFRL